MIRRRGMHLEDYQCVLCQQSVDETTMHLLFQCPFAKSCWNLVSFHFADHLTAMEIFQAWKSMMEVKFSLDLFILFCWGIWTVRNDVIFRNLNPSVANCQRYISTESLLLLHRTKASSVPLLGLV
jgi:hypothetical protein